MDRDHGHGHGGDRAYGVRRRSGLLQAGQQVSGPQDQDRHRDADERVRHHAQPSLDGAYGLVSRLHQDAQARLDGTERRPQREPWHERDRKAGHREEREAEADGDDRADRHGDGQMPAEQGTSVDRGAAGMYERERRGFPDRIPLRRAPAFGMIARALTTVTPPPRSSGRPPR
jgi:hypothetical protein